MDREERERGRTLPLLAGAMIMNIIDRLVMITELGDEPCMIINFCNNKIIIADRWMYLPLHAILKTGVFITSVLNSHNTKFCG